MKKRSKSITTLFLSGLMMLSLVTGCKGNSDTSVNSMPQIAKDSYTFAWMTDTQIYSETYPEIYRSMTKWLADSKETWNIKLVIHTGDITNNNTSREWTNAVNAMHTLDGVLPYTVLPGNHDVITSSSDCDYGNILKYFGKGAQSSDDPTKLWYQNGESSACLLEAGTAKHLILSLGWGATADTFTWADGLLKEYADRTAIITTHDYLKADTSLSKNGKEIFNTLVKPNSNVQLVLCGHKHTADKVITEIDDNNDGKSDRTVYQLIADYQEQPKGGNGFLRLLTFDEAAKTITVRTYSPYLDQYNCLDEATDSFIISTADWK